MTFEKLIKDDFFHLPKDIPPKNHYREFIFGQFEEYLTQLKKIQDLTIQFSGSNKPNNISNSIKIQTHFIEGLKHTINLYYDGQPANAYEEFSKTIEYRKVKFKKILNIGTFDLNENFYRIRLKEENFPLNSSEMFHIPFQMRGKVSTQRYSIPGYPSLYLAKTIYVAWEELKRPSLNKFQAVRLQNKEKIRYLDLTANNLTENLLSANSYKYLMTWPLIAACSIKVQENDDSFKPEYIIPQLLLQWTRNNEEIDGIKYISTHINYKNIENIGDLYNLVLPVKENKDEGYCSKLSSLFEITESVSNQLLELSNGGQIYLNSREDNNKIDAKIPPIEFINGRKTKYSSSVLGKLERTLDFMSLKKLL
ncbi:MAG TPA: RES domain-containing protein [Flavobacterium alvei]|nr:RES domain-containing protein [Flavobacterium alvei]